MTFTVLDIQKAIHEKLNEKINQIIEEEAKLAGERTVKRVKAATGEIVAQVASYFDYERMGDKVIITVKLDTKSS
jgi:hypothetical protein